MPSLRKRVSSYFRQLSFHNEPREKRNNFNENSFVNKYLQGQVALKDGPPILYGKTPTDLPNYDLSSYETGSETIIGCYTGPNGGLTTVKRTEKHLSMLDADIDFIDTQDEATKVEEENVRKSPRLIPGQPVDNTTMVIKVAGQEYVVTNQPKKRHNKSQSLGSLSDFQIEIEKTKSISSENNNTIQHTKEENNHLETKDFQTEKDEIISVSISNDKNHNDNDEKSASKNDLNSLMTDPSQSQNCDIDTSNGKTKEVRTKDCDNNKIVLDNNDDESKSNNQMHSLAKSKSEGNPFRHKKQGKIIRIERPTVNSDENAGRKSSDADSSTLSVKEDALLPPEWNRRSDYIFGMSDSLYDRNQVTKVKNGDPIADCFGIIARRDSAILAVADGVNWGEKACIAAKSAVHGCLHYLNKTIFNDTGPFENLVHHEGLETASCASSNVLDSSLSENSISNTREVFVCLLRAFNCAHDLILENNGMLTTLTVAVILPLSQSKTNTKHFETYSSNNTEKETAGPSENPQNKAQKQKEKEKYICCVCNVGDTLAYVYSQKHGIRELTKGSHDINCNRDMRDALGALGPVDGIKPELSNLTLSITTIEKGDIVLIASDGLSDNFDPNVCKFSVVNPNPEPVKPKRPSVSQAQNQSHHQNRDRSKENVNFKGPSATRDTRASSTPHRGGNTAGSAVKNRPRSTEIKADSVTKQQETRSVEKSKPPVKPPRRSKNRDSLSRSSTERSDSIEKASISESSEILIKRAPIASPTESLLTLNTPQEAPRQQITEKPKKLDDDEELVNPLVAQFLRDNSLDASNNSNSNANANTFERVKMALISPSTKNNQFVRQNDSFRASNVSPKQTGQSSSSSAAAAAAPAATSTSFTAATSTSSQQQNQQQQKKEVKTVVKTTASPPQDNLNKKIEIKKLSESPKSPQKQNYKLQYSKSMDVKKNDSNSNTKNNNSNPSPKGYAFLRSKTSLDIRSKTIARNADGIPYVTPIQRYDLTLLLMEDILKNGISGQETQVVTAKKLCENLLSFTFSITAAKRHTLEDNELYFDNRNGVLVEVSAHEKKMRRKKGLERVQNLPGKLDHVSIVAYNVGLYSH